jgi:NADH-quinone oxidoreductase subunit E
VLTQEEHRAIEAAIRHYPDTRAACVEAMKILQRQRGWLSDATLGDLAPLLGVSAAELDSVATFYSLLFRQPVGRHVILLCDSVSCWMLGADDLGEYLCKRLGIGPGETTHDGRFTVLPIPCLGTCENAPALMIDDELYGNLDTQRLDEILGRYT